MAPVVGLNRISPGSRLVDNEFTRKALEVVTATITGSIVLEKTGENKYTITWTQPSGDDRALTIPAMGADDQFTFNDATQTLTSKLNPRSSKEIEVKPMSPVTLKPF